MCEFAVERCSSDSLSVVVFGEEVVVFGIFVLLQDYIAVAYAESESYGRVTSVNVLQRSCLNTRFGKGNILPFIRQFVIPYKSTIRPRCFIGARNGFRRELCRIGNVACDCSYLGRPSCEGVGVVLCGRFFGRFLSFIRRHCAVGHIVVCFERSAILVHPCNCISCIAYQTHRLTTAFLARPYTWETVV